MISTKLIIIGLLAAVANCHAEQYRLVYTNSCEGVGDWAKTLQLPQFNPVIGKLLSAEIYIWSRDHKLIQLENSVAIDAQINFTVTTTTTVIVPLIAEISQFSSFLTVDQSFKAFDGKVDFSGPSGINTNVWHFPGIHLGPAKSDPFIGFGLFDVNLASFSTASGTNKTISVKKYATDSKVDVQVVYKYWLESYEAGGAK